MKNRRDTGLIGHARRALVIGVPAVGLALAMVGVVPAQQTLAQDSSGGSINIGGSIADTVSAAVSSIDTGSGSTTIGGVSGEQKSPVWRRREPGHLRREWGAAQRVGEDRVAQRPLSCGIDRRTIEGFLSRGFTSL